MAFQAGVRLGMPLASARGLAPQACIQALDASLLAQRFDALATLLLPYTPCLIQAEAYTLLLEVSASLKLFGGLRALRRQIANALQPQGVAFRQATTSCASGAWLLAVHPGRRIRHALSPASLARRLDTLDCRHLPAAQPYLDWLDGIGCRRLGLLRQLPRAELQRRTSEALLHELDCAYGQAHDSGLDWFVPPNQFHQRLELPAPGTRSELLTFAARRLLRSFRLWLDQHQQAATRISLMFEHDARRHATPFTPLILQSAQAIWQAEDWLRLLQAHLTNMALPAPALAVRLQSQMLQPRPAASASLLPMPGGQGSASYLETLSLLAARLGGDAILQASPRSDHRPEAANVWIAPCLHRADTLLKPANNTSAPTRMPADAMPSPSSVNTASTNAPEASPVPRPCWLLETPTPLSSQDSLPFHHGPLALLHGPERIEDGWWSTPMRRDYYVAQSAQGVRYWVFHTNQGERPGWYLHGLFG